jgi:hypothetical protein
MYFLKKIGKHDIEMNSYLIITMLFFWNIVTLFLPIKYFFKLDLKEYNNSYVIIGLLIGVPFLVFTHFFLYKNSKKIIEKYDSMRPIRKRVGKIIFWIYVIGTLPLFYYLNIHLQ